MTHAPSCICAICETDRHRVWRMGGTNWTRNEDRFVTFLILAVLGAFVVSGAIWVGRNLPGRQDRVQRLR